MFRRTNEGDALAADSSAEDSLVFNGEEVVFVIGHFFFVCFNYIGKCAKEY